MTAPDYPIESIRADFPMLRTQMNGKPLCYLDSAATSHKPQRVIDRISRFYAEEYGTVRRGAYSLSHTSTALFEDARAKAAKFLNTNRTEEIVFVRGCTEGINLVAISLGQSRIKEGDEILVSTMEHHSNIVPWQLLADRTGAKVRAIPIDESRRVRAGPAPVDAQREREARCGESCLQRARHDQPGEEDH